MATQRVTLPTPPHIIQNPISYGLDPKVKLIPMISTKVTWDGHWSSFDQLKAIVKGHFTGHHAFHLVHSNFMKAYHKKGTQVILQFPMLKLTYHILDQQNCVLFGSLLQICWGKTTKAIIKKHELEQDGIKTWANLLEWYDNWGVQLLKLFTTRLLSTKAITQITQVILNGLPSTMRRHLQS